MTSPQDVQQFVGRADGPMDESTGAAQPPAAAVDSIKADVEEIKERARR